MYEQMPPLTALRAFEAAARHLSLTKAALELHVTAGALSHQIRALEEFIGLDLFERRVRSIAPTPAGKLLYPGLQTGFTQIREAVSSVRHASGNRVLVISTPPGLPRNGWPRVFTVSLANIPRSTCEFPLRLPTQISRPTDSTSPFATCRSIHRAIPPW
jgi:LysR family transcriptional regulator, glycine cleavage system transcriptional activator